ncbi:PDR/VanB family oxidoreductase [Rhodococcoides kyotonense]|uniref:Ferredoxin-NADP reductase n=1 Tax=Rhodococcoides kyotonense TaxID=398843 RepID=A0A239NEF3_9NOCA|nr:PDR/VanB family oxidoreductase [Rhodococcus kyotonensis]SNT52678.1 Ferredoxin-NADP reductase [Rhodococcus kyotonensis]
MTLALRVRDIREVCSGVRQVVLVSADGMHLPSFTPGSNLSLEWAPGRRNSYSLTGPSVEPDHYAISVRLDENGCGGSRWVHALAVGDVVSAGRPRSAFAPVATARHHVLVAGGIGVTPILSHVRAAVQWGRSFEVLYAFRDGHGAHVEELRELAGDRLTTVGSSSELRAVVASALADRPLGSHVYSCGPLPMIETVSELARAAGWPAGRVHSEAFGAGPLDAGPPFAAKLGRSGLIVPVPSGVTLLEALLDKGIEVPNLCRQGVCGECKLTVRGGAIEHRDLYLTESEKAAGDCMMPCVSRAAGDLMEVEL